MSNPLGGPFVQGPRLPSDGDPTIRRLDDGRLAIEHNGTVLILSDFNAARVFGMLSLFLGIKLPTTIGRKIRL